MTYQQKQRNHRPASSLRVAKHTAKQKPFNQCSRAELVQEAKRQGAVKRAEELFKLRAPGGWSKELLESPYIGKLLKEQHLDHVKKILGKIQPKNYRQLEEAIKQAANSPQQRFLLLSEASMQGPLTPEAFQEYFTLVREILPKQFWQQMYGNKTPAQIRRECEKQMPQARKK
ncbi:MAG: hypothetical protein ABSE15_00460 [Candidatus Bathyarchaeia archaeon]|jgi:hypothetical protein